jgi:V8-like Glu-specific endopeptidase
MYVRISADPKGTSAFADVSEHWPWSSLGEPPPPANIPPPSTGSVPASRVADALASPYRCICRIVVRSYDKDGYSVGTGVLVSPFHVLTCAHVIYPPQAPRTKQIDVRPAQNGPDKDALLFRASGWAISPSWRRADCRTAAEDYGIIRLATPTREGFMRLRGFDPTILTSATVHLAGYPTGREERSRHMYTSQGRVEGAVTIERCNARTTAGRILPLTPATAGLIAHDLDTAGSQSGAPMWIDDRGTLTLIGLHIGILADNRKKAVLLNDAVQRRIQDWMNRALPPLRR